MEEGSPSSKTTVDNQLIYFQYSRILIQMVQTGINMNTVGAGIGLAFLAMVTFTVYNYGTAWFPQASFRRGGTGTVDAFGGY